ncbi:amino acid permease [Labrys okinawensis]|uniref:Amino acid permease n=1 Tax=Labrys okinawensis TaxID=346911 RepID=A0A2S9Q507_9HYPH|nr:amino acid permease [Labrys okinawensis]PRH84415.1 amino acid permease [Labrys okinawensis]
MASSLIERLTRKKPVSRLVADTADSGDGHGHLGRSITLFQLTMFGVGATIGTGIFFVLSEQVPVAGPAVVISFVIAAVAAGLSALCYAEMSSMIPVSGSSYSYAYATLGEGVAFFVAACLVLEYGISAAAVAVGWAEYVEKLLSNLTGIVLPGWMIKGPITLPDSDNPFAMAFFADGSGLINLPAVILVALCCLLLLRGSKESARTNAIMVLIKLAVLTLFIVIAGSAFNAANFTPFFGEKGFNGVQAAAASIFFTFVGLDAVSTAGEEVVNPKRNLPLAIIAALVIVTSFYVLVAVAALGVQPASQFDGQEAGLATILQNITGAAWPANLLAAGAVISIFSVTLIVLYGQSRILFAVSRDGMLPAIFHDVNPRTMTPVACTIIVSVFVALIAAFVPAGLLWDLTSMGTLVAFTVVSAGVLILRYTQPDMQRGYRVPFGPVLPILSIIACVYLILRLSGIVYAITGVWIAIAALLYFTYSARHSRLEIPDNAVGEAAQ